MTDPRFDPGGFFEFDLAKGAVRTRAGGRVLVVAEETFRVLAEAALASGDLRIFHRLGATIGGRVSESLGPNALDLAPETVAGHVGAILALFGFGRVAFEQWGDALVLELTHAPALDGHDAVAGALLGGIVGAIVGEDTACVPIGENRYITVHPDVADHVRDVARRARSVAAVVASLHRPEAS